MAKGYFKWESKTDTITYNSWRSISSRQVKWKGYLMELLLTQEPDNQRKNVWDDYVLIVEDCLQKGNKMTCKSKGKGKKK